MKIRIITNVASHAGKLADAELHFVTGPLAGLKLIGFSVWSRRGSDAAVNVTFPARSYTINSERRSFALLRPADADSTGAHDRIKARILAAYEDQVSAEQGIAAAVNLHSVDQVQS